MHLNKQKYDLIFGIGEACSCTQSLRKYDLQFASFPFDWLFGTNFIGRCQILAQRFNRFIEKKDLQDTQRRNSDKNNPCEVYYNTYNDITFNHDFFITQKFDVLYPIVKEKYDRRIARLLSKIETSKQILIVFLETPTTNHPIIDDKTIKKGYDIIAKAFPKTMIDMLYIQNSKDINKTELLTPHIKKIVLPYKCLIDGAVDYAVDVDKLECVFQNYQLNLSRTFLLKRKLQKILIKLIPIKQKRRQLRKKYHL